MTQGRCKVRLAVWQWAAVGNLWVWWSRVPGRHRVEWGDSTGLMQFKNWPCRRRVQHRQDGTQL